MCGRCIIFTYDEVAEIIRKIELDTPLIIDPDWPAKYPEAFPKSIAPLIVPESDIEASPVSTFPFHLGIKELIWGYDLSWKQGLIFNSRIESSEKPMWKDSIQRRRCILPVKGFFETHDSETVPSQRTGKQIKRPYEFSSPVDEIMLIGCIWEDDRFSMVTTEANMDMAPIHSRMPLVIEQEELPIWLGKDFMSLADRSDIRLKVKALG